MDAPPNRADPLPIYVLIGGRSRRFGADKASYLIDGEPWALHVANRLASAADPVVLVGDRSRIEAWSDSIVAPDAPNAPGPLGGLLGALADRESRFGPGRLCLASCDLVRPERAWLEPLLASMDPAHRLDGAAYRDAEGWQPFPSIMATSWRERLQRLADTGVTSLQAAFDASRIAEHAWPGPGEGPPQANMPEALRELLE